MTDEQITPATEEQAQEPERVEGRAARWIDATTIDLELRHPDLGWIPYTARQDDPEPLGRAIFEAAAAGEFGPVAPAQE